LFSQASHNSRLEPVEPVAGSTEVIARISDLIADLRPDDVDLLAAFHRIQHEFGYVPREAVPLLAGKFETTPAIIFGTIDFYSEIRTTPPAETTIEWCSGPACLLKGSLNIRRVLEAILECEMNRVSADGRFGLRLVQCDGTCHLAPLVRHRGRYLGPLSVSESIEWARELTGERGNGKGEMGTVVSPEGEAVSSGSGEATDHGDKERAEE
jgi:NADH:ubiquinone oxidoreductase subunit E